MERMVSERVGTGEWTTPAAEPVGFRAEGTLVARATSSCQVLRGEAARGR